MNNNKKAELVSSEEAAKKNFTTDNTLKGSCAKCGYKALLCYHYDDGKPVPEASFVLIDSDKKELTGKTDEKGLCLIEDMPGGAFEVLFEEGTDDFLPANTLKNNPVFQDDKNYSAIAGEHFTLFVLMRDKGYWVYEVDERIDNANFFQQILKKYQLAYDRFRQLDKQINQGDAKLRAAINKIYSSLSGEIANQASGDLALMLFSQILSGFVPVVNSALDVYDLGCWGCKSFDKVSEQTDYWLEGSLILTGFVPELGDALKKIGFAIVKSERENTPEAIQTAIRKMRGLSNGDVKTFLNELRSNILSEYAEKVTDLVQQIIEGLKDALAQGKSWIEDLLSDKFSKFIEILEQLKEKIPSVFDDFKSKIADFIDKITTRLSGAPYPKNTKYPLVKLNAGKNTEPPSERPAHEQLEIKKLVSEKNSYSSSEEGTCINGCPIDMATGNVVEWRTDIEIIASLGLSLKRFYHSGGEHVTGLLGSRWRTNWDATLTSDKGTACFSDWQYTKAYYVIPTQEGERTQASHLPQWTLVRKSGALEMHEKNGLCYRFAHAMGKTLILSHISDKFGRTHQFIYDRGLLKGIMLHDGRVIKVTTRYRRIEKLTLHDNTGKLLSTLANYQYDKQGFLTACRAGHGKSFDYQYSPEGYLLRWQDLSQTWVEHDYDAKGRAIRSRGADNRFCDSLFYDDENKVVHYHSPLQGTKKYYRDARNNIIRIDMPNGEITLNTWVDNQLVSTINALGETSTFTRDTHGNITSHIAPDGSEQSWQYDENGLLISFTNRLGKTWQAEHDEQGNLIAIIDPLNAKTQFEYNEQGQCISVTDADGVELSYGYDSTLGLVNFIQQGDKEPLNIQRDILGRITQAKQGTQAHYWHYLVESQLASHITDEQNQTLQAFQYDVEGNVVQSIDAKGQKYQYRYGAFDVLTQQIDPLGQALDYFYNGECQFAGFRNHKNEQWRYQFDSSGRITTETHLDGRQHHFTYDKANNLTRITRADGSSIHHSYDACSRLLCKDFYQADGTITDSHHFSYDSEGLLLSGSNSVSEVHFSYDDTGRIIQEQQNEHKINYEFTAAGRLAQSQGLLLPLEQQWQGGYLANIRLGNFDPLHFNYDSLGREQARHHERGFSLQQQFNAQGLLSHQQAGRFLGRRNDSANNQQVIDVERHYGYDALGQLCAIDDKHWGNTRYQHNALGQITSESRTAPWHSHKEQRHFNYDNQQLTSVEKSTTNNVNQAEEIIRHSQEKTLQYGNAGRVIKQGNATLRYDSNGRLSEKIIQNSGFRPQTTKYRWNAADELISVKLDNGDCWHYEYDVFGRRIRKYRIQQQSASKHTQTHYQWQGDQLCQQQKVYADGSLATTQWLYEPDSFRPLAQARHLDTHQGNIELHFAITDIGGNVRELCTPEGEIEWRGEAGLWQDFLQWRKPQKQKQYLEEAANEPLYCDLRFQGQLYDKETGLYYNRHRYYDPEICQYISPDPIGMQGGLQPQAYVHNPLEWVDPFGLNENKCGEIVNSEHGGESKLLFEPNPKHGKTQRGRANPEPSDPQRALDNSIKLPGNTSRRIYADKETGEFSVFDEHRPNLFHGHTRSWNELDQTMQSILRKAGLVNKKGKIK